MESSELIADGLGRVNQLLHRALKGVSSEVLNRMPTPETNSMAWLAWHLTRVHDHHLADMEGVQQLWTSSGWHARFNMRADDGETGGGHTLDQVAALHVDSETVLLEYNDAVYQRTTQFLSTLKPDDFDREIDEPQYDPLPTVGVRLVSVLSDNTQHAGQIAYLRGYFEGFGWRG